MKIQAVMRKICPAYDRHVERRRLMKLLFSPAREEYVSKYTQRRGAVREYLDDGIAVAKYNDFDFIPNHDNLTLGNVNEFIENCGDDLEKIKHNFGIYGLAKYAQMKPEFIMRGKSANINEVAYADGKPLAKSFYEYMLLNKVGSVTEMISRFGECGKYLYDQVLKMGYVHTGNDSYKMNSFGERQIMLSLVKEKVSPQLDAILSVFE